MNSTHFIHRYLLSAAGIACFLSLGSAAFAQAADITAPGDPVVGVAATPGGPVSLLAVPGMIGGFNNYPPLEPPPNATDDLPTDKYLNFQKTNAGIIVTPSGTAVVGGLRFTTGNDFPERDPMNVLLEGSTDANATVSLNSTWVPIYSGISGLATDPGRNTPGALVSFPNSTAYASYRVLIWNVRDTPGIANSFQFAEIELLGGSSGSAFCFGDGSGTACPCGNNSASGSNTGCLNSLGSGARLTALGSPSITGDTIVLSGSLMANSSALYYQGTTQLAGGAGAVFGDGLRCAGGSVIRLGVEANVAGSSQYPGTSQAHVSVKGMITSPGTRTYQVWYRNAAAFCNPETFNLTNGWTLAWTP
jgi:hypothetical protein